MSAPTSALEITRREGRGSALLWFGVLGAPLAWTVELVAGYSLEEWFACSPATSTPGDILGLDVRAVALGISLATVVVAVAAGLVSLRCLRRIEPDATDRVHQRARWMAIAGIMNSTLYGLAIVTSMFAPLILRVCETTP